VPDGEGGSDPRSTSRPKPPSQIGGMGKLIHSPWIRNLLSGFEVGQLYPIRTLSVGLAKCVVFSGEIILLFSYTVFRYARYTGIRDRISNNSRGILNFGKERSERVFFCCRHFQI
jgi:hypothetical protein